MFKWKASLIFAVIAALAVALAGFLKDVRFVTIALRSVVGFLVAGLTACLVIALLEMKGIMNFSAVDEPVDGAGAPTPEEESPSQEGDESEDGTQGADGEPEEQPGEEAQEEFQPLDAQSLRRMEAPPES